MVCTICALINPVIKQHIRCTLPLTNKKKPLEMLMKHSQSAHWRGLRSLNKQFFLSSSSLHWFYPYFSRVFTTEHTRFYLHWQCSANENPRVKLTSAVFETRSFSKRNVLHTVYIFHTHITHTLVKIPRLTTHIVRWLVATLHDVTKSYNSSPNHKPFSHNRADNKKATRTLSGQYYCKTNEYWQCDSVADYFSLLVF